MSVLVYTSSSHNFTNNPGSLDKKLHTNYPTHMKHLCHKHPAIFGSPDPGWSHNEDPCQCSCDPCREYKRCVALPDITDEEITSVREMLEGATPGPWQAAQLKGFGAERFIVSTNESSNVAWHSIVAELKNPGSFKGDEFIAWCRDGVPRLLKLIEAQQDKILDLQEELYWAGMENDVD
jgi:hypothetical protein